jgi:hypothetical protein
MIRSSYDLDVVVYFPHKVRAELYDLHYRIALHFRDEGHEVSHHKVAVRVPFEDTHVDIVPGLAQDANWHFAELYRSDTRKALRSSLPVHANYVKNNKLEIVVRLLKMWRQRAGLEVSSFVLELLAGRALQHAKRGNVAVELLTVLSFIHDHAASIQLSDPASDNNIIEIDERKELHHAASGSLLATRWDEVI